MLIVIEYGNGLKNARLDVILLDRALLNKLYDDNSMYYGRLKDILKQVLLSFLLKLRSHPDGNHDLNESSAYHQPFLFDNNIVKKLKNT